jgi:hypothetical protein
VGHPPGSRQWTIGMDNRQGEKSGARTPPTSVVLVAGVQFLASAGVLIFWCQVLWGLVVYYRRYPNNHEVFEPEFWIFYIGLPVCFALLGLLRPSDSCACGNGRGSALFSFPLYPSQPMRCFLSYVHLPCFHLNQVMAGFMRSGMFT